MPRSVPLRSCTALRDSLLQCEGMAVCCCNPPDNNSRCCRPAQVKVAPSDVRGLLETMVAADFLDLQQKSFMMLNPDEEDWRKLKLHSISIKATRGSARRDFSAGEYGGEHQEIPTKFGIIESAIAELISKANSTGAHGTVAPSLWSD